MKKYINVIKYAILISLTSHVLVYSSWGNPAVIQPIVRVGGAILSDIIADVGKEMVCKTYKIPTVCREDKTKKSGQSQRVFKAAKFIFENFDTFKRGIKVFNNNFTKDPSLISKAMSFGLSKDLILSAGPTAVIIFAFHNALAQAKMDIIEKIKSGNQALFSATQHSIDNVIKNIDSYNMKNRILTLKSLKDDLTLAEQRYADLPIEPTQDQVHYLSNKILDAIKSSRILYDHTSELKLWELYLGIRLAYGLADKSLIIEQLDQVLSTPSPRDFYQSIQKEFCKKFASGNQCVTNEEWESERTESVLKQIPLKNYLDDASEQKFKVQLNRLISLRNKLSSISFSEDSYVRNISRIHIPVSTENRIKDLFELVNIIVYESRDNTLRYALDLDIKLDSSVTKAKVSFNGVETDFTFKDHLTGMLYKYNDLTEGVRVRGKDEIEGDQVIIDYRLQGSLFFGKQNADQNKLTMRFSIPRRLYGRYQIECSGFDLSIVKQTDKRSLTCASDDIKPIHIKYKVRSTSR